MNFLRSNLAKRVLPIIALALIIAAYFLGNPRIPHGPSTIIDDNVPLAGMATAYFMVAHPDVSFDDISLLTEDMFDFVGEGTVSYTKDILNDSDAVKKAIIKAPDTGNLLIDWRYMVKYNNGSIIVAGVYNGSLGVEADYYLFDLGSSETSFTNVTPDMAVYIGTGLYDYTEDLYNDADTVWSQVVREPDYSAPSGQYIQWGSAFRYTGRYVVIGRYKSGAKPPLAYDTTPSQEIQSDTEVADDEEVITDEEILADEDIPVESPDSQNASATFSTIKELANSDLPVGTIVKTEGYNNAGDNGSAKYIITDSPEYKTDNIFVMQTRNKKYAQLLFDPNSYINVAAAGIQPNDNISSKLNSFMYFCNNRVKGISFGSGTYYIDSTLHLTNLTLKGTGNTDLVVSHDFAGSGSTVINSASANVSFEGINFIYHTDSTHPLANRESVFISLGNTSHTVINNCTFTAENDSPGTNIAIDLLWFNHASSVENVTISNCTFKNLNGSNADDSVLRGGCLWFCGPSGTTNCNFSNITIANCSFIHTTNDESIGMWNGQFNNITIKGNSIHIKDHTSNNILSCFKGGFHNVEITNNKFRTSSIAKSAVKLELLDTASSVNISDCEFDFDYPSADPYSETQSIILHTGDSAGSTVTFNHNTVSTPSNTKYRSLINCKNNSNIAYTVTNNQITCPLVYGLIYINTCQDIDTDIRDNTVDNSAYIATTSNCSDSSLNVSGNTISSTNTILVKGSTTLDYGLSGNQFKTNSNSFITYSSSAQNTSDIRLTTD